MVTEQVGLKTVTLDRQGLEISLLTHKHYLSKADSGATFLEASLTFVIFFTIVLTAIDLSRYFYFKTVLSSALAAGVDKASKLILEMDLDEENCGSDTSCTSAIPDRAETFKNYLELVEQTVKEKADLVPLTRKRYTHFSTSVYGSAVGSLGTLKEFQAEIGLVRPGDKVFLSDDSSVTFEIPSRPYGQSVGQGWPKSAEGWGTLLSDHPFGLVMSVDFYPVTLLNKVPLRIDLIQFGTRAKDMSGRGVPNFPTEAPRTATPTPTPTFTPRNTPILIEDTPIATIDVPDNTPTHTPTNTATSGTPSPTYTVAPLPTKEPAPFPTSTFAPATLIPTATRTKTPTSGGATQIPTATRTRAGIPEAF